MVGTFLETEFVVGWGFFEISKGRFEAAVLTFFLLLKRNV